MSREMLTSIHEKADMRYEQNASIASTTGIDLTSTTLYQAHM